MGLYDSYGIRIRYWIVGFIWDSNKVQDSSCWFELNCRVQVFGSSLVCRD